MLILLPATHVVPDIGYSCWSRYRPHMLIRVPAKHVDPDTGCTCYDLDTCYSTYVDPDTGYTCWSGYQLHMLSCPSGHTCWSCFRLYTCLSRYQLHMSIRDTVYTCLSRYRLHMFWSGCRPKFLILLHSYSWRKKRERQHNLVWTVINKNIMVGGFK